MSSSSFSPGSVRRFKHDAKGRCLVPLLPRETSMGVAGDRPEAFHLYALERAAPLPVTGSADACLTCGTTLGIVEAGDPAWKPGPL